VIDVHGQFDTGNPSHHAVRGARYSTQNGTDYICDRGLQGTCDSASKCISATCNTGNTWLNDFSACDATVNYPTQALCEAIPAQKGKSAVWRSVGWGTPAWKAYITSGTGLDLSQVREAATLHCADCHTVDTNAHSGSNNFMLTAATIDGVCWNCHSSTNYGNVASPNSRFLHNRDSHAWDAGTGSKLDSNTSGGHCLKCHGGAEYDGYGAIHGIASGNDKRLQDNSITQERYRFIGGSYMSMQTDFTSGGTTMNCYMNSNSKGEQRWSYCSQHSSGSPGSTPSQYPRGTSY